MGRGLWIEGIGSITWTFYNPDGGPVQLTGLAYYVSDAKARLLSPQRLFDGNKVQGYYEDNHKALRLHITGHPVFTIEYDNQNSLPVGYAIIGKHMEPQLNLSLTDSNQNLTGGQKLLLRCHHQFGHLNLPDVQSILYNVPFLSNQFSAVSKYNVTTLPCLIYEFAKGH
jgi:hypothetical protein